MVLHALPHRRQEQQGGVHVQMTPKPIQRRRVKGWRKPANTVFVDRAAPGTFGNPFKTGKPGILIGDCIDRAYAFDVTPLMAVQMFDDWLTTGVFPMPDGLRPLGRDAFADHLAQRRDTILKALPALRGKNLACTCPLGAPCHRDVLLRMANEGAQG
jgi:Domain of unknown function (DUF4326)